MKEFHINKVKENFGKRFGRLVILDYDRNNKRGGNYLCQCDCGNKKIVDITRLRSGVTKSCGCFRKDKMRELISSGVKKSVKPNIKHGMRNNELYQYWIGAKRKGWEGEFLEFYNTFNSKFQEAKKHIIQPTLKNIHGEWLFIKKSDTKKYKKGYRLDGEISCLEELKSKFGITRKLGLKIISENIDTTDDILDYIKQYNINNKGMTEYKGKLYTCQELANLHKELTGEYIESHTLNDRYRRYGYNKDDVIEGKINMSKSQAELEILNYIKSIYSGTVLSGYKGIGGLEIDIYIPELHIGFEYNGIFFHQTLTDKFIESIGGLNKNSRYSPKEKKYHYNKKILAKEKGIDLYTIWEDQYKNKKEVIYDFINNKLGLTKNKIYARKCIVEEISNTEYLTFCEKNHMQGAGGLVSVAYGLFHKSELVGVAGFSNNELKRYCTLLGYNIVGGFSKILSHYIKENNPGEIKTFADFDVVSIENNIYKNLGFIGETVSITYNYFKYDKGGYKRYHKALFRKDKIMKRFNYIFGDGETEYEAMEKLGFFRCYNSGIQRYILKVQNNHL